MSSSTAGPLAPRIPRWVGDLTPAALRDLFGETMLRRGRAYQREGAVGALNVAGLSLVAEVYGTHRYEVTVSWRGSPPLGGPPADRFTPSPAAGRTNSGPPALSAFSVGTG